MNELLEALKKSDDTYLAIYLSEIGTEPIRKDILDLLTKQREKCTEEAIIIDEGTYSARGESMEYYVVDKESILNAKLF